MNSTPIIWCRKKQTCVAMSTMEAEYISAVACTKVIIGTRQMLNELGFWVKGPVFIYEDNEACIHAANNPETSSRTQHIRLRHHLICEQIRLRKIVLKRCPTSEMKAHLLTKALMEGQHEKLSKLMNLRSCNDGECKNREFEIVQDHKEDE